jgi:hypothetical protein
MYYISRVQEIEEHSGRLIELTTCQAELNESLNQLKTRLEENERDLEEQVNLILEFLTAYKFIK